EDPAVAALMNRYFVNIKVDREERPDIDSVYMTAVQALTGQGGWPMTVFMAPDGRPFYAGTYFPPDDGYGRPGFPRVLEVLHDKWTKERAEILESAASITAHLQKASERPAPGVIALTHELGHEAAAVFAGNFDAKWGGFGMAPKFPGPANLEFLLAYGSRVGEAEQRKTEPIAMVLQTLDAMANGGMYDQLGGGFARYSVDERWLVPHFEKMLYDNAQLARVYLHAFQVTREERFERVARETLDYLEREMLDAEGGFYAAQDADSEGIEGKYFVWTKAEVEAVAGADAKLACAWFGVTAEGNFTDPHHAELTGRNVLTAWAEVVPMAERFGLSEAGLANKVAEIRAKLLAARGERIPPGLDDKQLTSWNGLAVAAFAEAARVLGDGRYRQIAECNAAFVRAKLWQEGRLLHTYKAGRASVEGLLEDYAYYGLGLVELFKLTGEMPSLDWARELFECILEGFHDDAGGGFFEAGVGGEQLLVRQKPLFDAASPSGNGAAALLGMWLGRYYGNREWEGFVQEVVGLVSDHLAQAASGFGTLLQGIEFALAPRREVAIVGQLDVRSALEREVAREYRPWLVVAPSSGEGGLPLFEGRAVESGALAYVCEDMACQLPVADAGALREQLGRQDTPA
ncbi:MAG: thioredoxin domain-containing protein, partial [Tepidiformaceae bacterium]